MASYYDTIIKQDIKNDFYNLEAYQTINVKPQINKNFVSNKQWYFNLAAYDQDFNREQYLRSTSISTLTKTAFVSGANTEFNVPKIGNSAYDTFYLDLEIKNNNLVNDLLIPSIPLLYSVKLLSGTTNI